MFKPGYYLIQDFGYRFFIVKVHDKWTFQTLTVGTLSPTDYKIHGPGKYICEIEGDTTLERIEKVEEIIKAIEDKHKKWEEEQKRIVKVIKGLRKYGYKYIQDIKK